MGENCMKLNRSLEHSKFALSNLLRKTRRGVSSFEHGALSKLADQETKHVRHPRHCPSTIKSTFNQSIKINEVTLSLLLNFGLGIDVHEYARSAAAPEQKCYQIFPAHNLPWWGLQAPCAEPTGFGMPVIVFFQTRRGGPKSKSTLTALDHVDLRDDFQNWKRVIIHCHTTHCDKLQSILKIEIAIIF